MATKKAGGSTSNGRDSIGKRLGLKVSDGQFVTAGSILVRQRGSTYLAGSNVSTGSDYTLYALEEGSVLFKRGRGGKVSLLVNRSVSDS